LSAARCLVQFVKDPESCALEFAAQFGPY